MKRLRVGIVGMGGMGGGAHLRAWSENPDTEVAAVCDCVEKRAAQPAKRLGIPHSFTDYRKLLAMEDIDVVDICTPNDLHSIIAVEALEQGKHVFCEKPDAVTVSEALRMKQASERAGRQLMVMRNNRFLPSVQFLKSHISQDGLGEVYAAKCGWVRVRGIPGKGGWFTTKAESGGGPLIDLGVHMIDVAVWLMGNPRPVAVVGSTFRAFADDSAKVEGTFDVEDLALGFIRFANGASLQIEFSWASNIEAEDKYYELLGTKGGAKWHSTDKTLKLFGEVNGVPFVQIPQVRNSGPGEHQKNINHFADCLVRGTEPIFKPEQGVDMIRILTSIYASAEQGREIRLED